jgi:hypothetical protein
MEQVAPLLLVEMRGGLIQITILYIEHLSYGKGVQFAMMGF